MRKVGDSRSWERPWNLLPHGTSRRNTNSANVDVCPVKLGQNANVQSKGYCEVVHTQHG